MKYVLSSIVCAAVFAAASPLLAQTAPPPASGITLSPTTTNANNAQSQAQSNPVGENINQQSNYNYSGQNSFAPGITCSTPYITSSVSRFDGSQSGGTGQGNFSGSLGLVVPLGGISTHNCLKLADEIVMQRQLDTCLNIRRAGFKFDPTVFPELAKRCNGLVFDPPTVAPQAPTSLAPATLPQISPATPPTVITVPANPVPSLIFPAGRQQSQARRPARVVARRCLPASAARKHALLRAIRKGRADRNFPAYLSELRAACVSFDEVAAVLVRAPEAAR